MSGAAAPAGRSRETLRLLTTTLLAPLLLLALGVWEVRRGADDLIEAEEYQGRVAKAVAILEARPAPPGGRPDYGATFRRDGHNYAGPIALDQARAELGDAEWGVGISRFRQLLPPVVVAGGAVVAGLSVLTLLAALALGRAGRASRDALVRGFGLVRRALPPVLGLQVVLGAAAIVAAVVFESLAIAEAGDLSSGGVKMLGIAAVAVLGCIWTAWEAVKQLRRALDLFTPDPLPVAGRPVTREAAPGLWRMVDDLATRLGALRPDNVVVGLTGGFFVSSGPKVLRPGGAELAGRTLYLPLPFLPLLREDEVATIIGHELAHFSGGDTEYSLRFLPIYVGVGRSLDAVALAGMAGDGSVSPLMRPALTLGNFVMDRFHHAVLDWSRRREFEADAAGASVTSADAGARALLRTAAANPRIDETLGTAFREPASAPPDLVAAVLSHAAERGLDDPAAHLEETQPHPTDTHPPHRQRIAALGREPDAAMLADAAAPPPPDALSRLDALFADPAALSRAATEDFLATARDAAREEHEALETAAAGIPQEAVTLREPTRVAGILLVAIGGVVMAAVLVLAALTLNAEGGPERWVISGIGAAVGLSFLGFGLPLLRRGDRPFLVLRPEAVDVVGLDRPIAWGDIADLDMLVNNGGVSTRLLLRPEAPMPARVRGGRGVKVDPARRIVTFAGTPPKHLKVGGFVDLIADYRRAELARRLLAEEAGRPAG